MGNKRLPNHIGHLQSQNLLPLSPTALKGSTGQVDSAYSFWPGDQGSSADTLTFSAFPSWFRVAILNTEPLPIWGPNSMRQTMNSIKKTSQWHNDDVILLQIFPMEYGRWVDDASFWYDHASQLRCISWWHPTNMQHQRVSRQPSERPIRKWSVYLFPCHPCRCILNRKFVSIANGHLGNWLLEIQFVPVSV